MAAGPLRSRIRRILQLQDDPMLISGRSLTIALGSLVIVATLLVLYLPARGSAEESAAEAKESATEATEATESTENTGANANEQSRLSDPLSDDWPAGVVFASPTDSETSKEAWKMLGLKLVPATSEELSYSSASSGVKVVGGNSVANLLENPDPLILFKVHTVQIRHFDDIRKVLQLLEVHPRQYVHVSCLQVQDLGGPPGPVNIEFPVQYPAQISKAGKAEDIAANANRKFPSLEEQKLADQAWKRLGLELEQLGPEDRERVQKFGYDGGLKVANIGGNPGGILPGDILVGLHVWPTTSFEAVIDVLNRPDIAELNPLKYYVVRRSEASKGFGGGRDTASSDEARDIVVTGRIAAGPILSTSRTIQPGEEPPTVGEPFDIVVSAPHANKSGDERLEIARDEQNASQPKGIPFDLKIVLMPPEAAEKLQEAFQARLMERARYQHEVEARIGEAAQRLGEVRGQQALRKQQLAKLQAEATADLPDGRKHELAMQMEQLRQQIAGLREEAAKQTQAIQKHAEEIQQNAERLKRDMEEQQRQAEQQAHDAEEQAHDAEKAEAEQRSYENFRQSTGLFVAPPVATLPGVPHMPGQPPSAPAPMPAPHMRLAPPPAPAPSAPATQMSPPIVQEPSADFNTNFRGPTTSAMPYLVRFEQGASRFLDGDKITIHEVRGTAETFKPGNVYCIKGTYKLSSHDRARLDAYTTAKDAAYGTSETWKIQTIVVKRGSGTFELFLPYSYEGWPHVSFYPADGGEGFGGTYFGTGDSVLKKWSEVYGEMDASTPTTVSDENVFGGEEVPKSSAIWAGRRGDGADFQGPEGGVVEFRSSKPDLRYNGKTFDQWRDEWRNELSTVKRLEAVKALAAFGANGHGKEAAEAILGVAGQYDWATSEGSGSVGSLKEACLDEFSGHFSSGILPYQLPQDDALAALLAGAQYDDAGTRRFVAWGLARYAYEKPKALNVLLKLSHDADEGVRSSAFEGLPAPFGKLKANGELLARIKEGLASDDPKINTAAICKLAPQGDSQTYYVPELFPKLFSKNELVRRCARAALVTIQPQDASQVCDQLLVVLGDKTSENDRVEAIRALAALGPQAKPAVGRLGELLLSQNQAERVAAAAALKLIAPGDYNKMLVAELGDEYQIRMQGDALLLPDNPKRQEFNRYCEAVDREMDKIVPEGSGQLVGRGGGFF